MPRSSEALETILMDERRDWGYCADAWTAKGARAGPNGCKAYYAERVYCFVAMGRFAQTTQCLGMEALYLCVPFLTALLYRAASGRTA